MINPAYTIAIDTAGIRMDICFSGSLHIGIMAEAHEERIADAAAFAKIKYLVTDYMQADLNSLSAEDVRAYATMTEQVARINPELKIFGLMPNQLEYGLTRMWQAYTSHLPIQSTIMKDMTAVDIMIAELEGASRI